MFKLCVRTAQAAVVFACLPAVALAADAPLTPARVFLDAAPSQKLLMIGLFASMVAAGLIAIRKLAAGPALAGGSAFISNLRLGGPLFGLLGAAYCALFGAIGVANINPDDMRVIAPGVAESLLIFTLGVLAGCVAVLCHWAIEARIDKAVLRP